MADGLRVADLLPERLELGPAAEAAMREGGGEGGAGLAWDLVSEQAGEALRGLLDCDLLELIARGWLKAEALGAYADPAKHPPGETSVVPLAEHRIGRDLHPVLAIGVAGLPPVRLRFTVSLAAHFKGLSLSILDGHVTGGATGEAWCSASLKYGGVKLTKEGESRRLKLPGRFAFTPPGLRIPPQKSRSDEQR